MKRYLILLLTVVWLALPSSAPAIEGLPGSTWGNIYEEFPHPGGNDTILNGWVRQGVAWKRWDMGGDTTLVLDTYATVRYYWDSRGFDWFNDFGPGGGVSLDLSAPSGPSISGGAEYIYQMNYTSGTQQPYTNLFLNWYHWWDIRENNFPGSTWGDLLWKIPTHHGENDVLLEGWIKQGIVLKRWQAGSQTFVLDPYVTARYRYDSLGLDWNNYIGPGGGIALEMESSNGPLLSWGVEYDYQKNISGGSNVNRIEAYMRWYAWWDLKKK